VTLRAATSGEQTLTQGQQASELYFDYLRESVVFKALVNETISSTDAVYEFGFDSVSEGAYTDVEEGMLAYLGSTEGAKDLGVVRVRKAPASSQFYIGETSDTEIEDDAHLTVIDNFQIFQRHPYIDEDAITYMDRDIAYSDQHLNFAPIGLIGSPVSVIFMDDAASVDWSPQDASGSVVFDSSVASYLWTITGGFSVADSTTSQPTFTITAAGQYRYTCVITGTNGAVSTHHRYLFVYDSDNMPISLQSRSVTFSKNGWSFEVTVNNDASDIPANTVCSLFSRDYFAGTEQYIAQSSESPYTVAVGWIDTKSVQFNESYSTAPLKAYTAEYFADKMLSYAVGFDYTDGTPASWTEMKGLTVDRAVWHLLYWRTTIATLVDMNLSGDTKNALALYSPFSTILDQANFMANESILAEMKSDMYANLHLQVDLQLTPEADRSSVVTVFDITESDFSGDVLVREQIQKQVSFVDFSGVAFDGVSEGFPLRAKSPGTTVGRFGDSSNKENLLLDSQSEVTKLAGLEYARRNAKYLPIQLDLKNVKLIDGAPNQYCTLTIPASKTIGGVSITAERAIPRKITRTFRNGFLSTSADFELETLSFQAVTIPFSQAFVENFPPAPNFTGLDFEIAPFGGFSVGNNQPEYIPQNPEIDADIPCRETLSVPSNGPFLTSGSGTQFSNVQPSLYLWLKCYIRSSAHTFNTSFFINGSFEKFNPTTGEYEEDIVDTSWYNVYGIRSGLRVWTATKAALVSTDSREFNLEPPSSTLIDNIEVAIDENTNIFDYTAGSLEFSDPTGSTEPVGPGSSEFWDFGSGVKGITVTSWNVPSSIGADAQHKMKIPYVVLLTPSPPLYYDVDWDVEFINSENPLSWTLDVQPIGISSQRYRYNNQLSGTAEGLEAASVSTGIEFILTVQYRTIAPVTNASMKIVASVKQTSDYRIVYNNSQIFNICSVDES